MNIFWSQFAWIILGILIGGVSGFFLARYYLQKELKKNPPISEKQIRAMFMQMGRKPSEAQIKSIMKSMGQ
ncbi:MAG: YneF family protein [Erysipelotrichaceae bacterium]|nr:YneF family protein [Erysipelotrichaceae bacterium]